MVKILYQQSVFASWFYVDTGLERTELQTPITKIPLLSADGVSEFGLYEKINLLSIWFVMPNGFEVVMFGNQNDSIVGKIELRAKYSNGDFLDFPEMPRIKIVPANYEHVINQHISLAPTEKMIDEGATSFQLYANFATISYEPTYINMLGVPEYLNAKNYKVPIFIKIEHTRNVSQ